jgi:hypothetical protein
MAISTATDSAERRAERLVRGGAPLLAFLLVGLLVVSGSRAAFSATTGNSGNTFSSGTVTLTDDDAGSAMFTASGMKPGSSSTNCIAVTYGGSLVPADVKLYGSTGGTGLSSYLNVTLDIGAGGSMGSCGGFVSSSTLYSGTLAAFVAAHSDWSTGQASWTPASTPDSRTFRFVMSLPSGTSNAAQGLTATATFTWEAQNQ